MDDLDLVSNPSRHPHMNDIIEARLSRRGFLGGGVAAGLAAFTGIDAVFGAVPASAASNVVSKPPKSKLLGFEAIPTSTLDTVVVPKGYTANVLVAWGDPVSDGPAFKQDASNTAAEQAQQWGMHNDGVVYFPIQGSSRGLLVQNNEYTDDGLLFTDGTAAWTAEKTNKALNAHGVSIVEITKQRGGQWRVERPSTYARRITGQTPIDIVGPAAGDARLKTSADTTGTRVLGTLNNCAMGFTPWTTYLACEENFNGYFNRTISPDTRSNIEKRYGIAPFGNPGAKYWTTHARFNADVEPNEPNRFGWVVEIDPFDPTSTPKKRTALGRLKHEGAWVQEAYDGRIVVYMGDDERNEYLYRYVSAYEWEAMLAYGVSPLDDGTLYVAKFHADGTGEWLPLTPDNPELEDWTLADILINTRAAADKAGATMMDRPEWADTFPDSLTGIITLTNNNRRGSTRTARGPGSS